MALTDIISVITDADEQNPAHREILRTYLDATIAQHFGTFGFTDLQAILADHPTIRSVYLTRLPGIPLFDERWATVIRFAGQHPERGLHIRTLLTPSGYARYQIGDFKRANPGLKQPLRHFIHHSWSQQWRRIKFNIMPRSTDTNYNTNLASEYLKTLTSRWVIKKGSISLSKRTPGQSPSSKSRALIKPMTG